MRTRAQAREQEWQDFVNANSEEEDNTDSRLDNFTNNGGRVYARRYKPTDSAHRHRIEDPENKVETVKTYKRRKTH